MTLKAEERLIVALDTGNRKEITEIMDTLEGVVKWVKIGAYPFTAFGPDSIRWAKNRGYKVFLDMKYHDIPNTVAHAIAAAISYGVDMITVHTMGGFSMMESAIKETWNVPDAPVILGVTVLTSLDSAFLKDTLGASRTLEEEVVFLAQTARSAGLTGVVSSVNEAKLIRERVPDKDFIVVTPGIRLENDSVDDQKRIATPEMAIQEGADYIVVGRPITQSEDPVKSAQVFIERLKKAEKI